MLNAQVKTFTASAIVSEIQSSDIYLTVKARLFDLKPNANGVICTEAFLDEIVENEDKYIGIPLCADVRGLIANRKIDHMYNRFTKTYSSSFIGSFYHFEKEQEDDNAFLVGYARIMKRHKDICSAVQELFDNGQLKFSFEISASDYYQNADGNIVVDMNEGNFLEGVAIVTFPACKEAVALDLIAECEQKGDEKMGDIINQPLELDAEQQNEVNAAVVTQARTEIDEVFVYTDEMDTSIRTVTETRTTQHVDDETINNVRAERDNPENEGTQQQENENAACHKKENAENQNAACGKKKNAEDEDIEDKEDPDMDENTDTPDEDENNEVTAADEQLTEEAASIDSIVAAIDMLTKQINEIRAQLDANPEEFIASFEPQLEELPEAFMADITTENTYSLLESSKETVKGYTLL